MNPRDLLRRINALAPRPRPALVQAHAIAECGDLSQLQPTSAAGQETMRDLMRAIHGGYHRGDGFEKFCRASADADFLGVEPVVPDFALTELLKEIEPLITPSPFD